MLGHLSPKEKCILPTERYVFKWLNNKNETDLTYERNMSNVYRSCTLKVNTDPYSQSMADSHFFLISAVWEGELNHDLTTKEMGPTLSQPVDSGQSVDGKGNIKWPWKIPPYFF